MRRRRLPERICPACRISFAPLRPQTYCSRACARQRYKLAAKDSVIRICETCREQFYLMPSVARNIAGRFCSPECWHKAPRNDGMSRGDRIEMLRDLLLPNLRVGSMIPPCAKLAEKLNVTHPTAIRDVRYVLEEAGVRTKLVNVGARMIVVEMPATEDTDA